MKILRILAAGLLFYATAILGDFAPLSGGFVQTAHAQPCQWNYGFVANVATATYCGNVIGNTINAFNSVASMAALSAPLPNSIYTVAGYNAGSNLGGGTFTWTLGACTPDGGVNIASTVISSAVGCYKRSLVGSTITFEMWGADPTSSLDQSAPLLAAKTYAANHNLPCIDALGPYHIASEFNFNTDGLCIVGQSAVGTKFIPMTNGQAVFRISAQWARLENVDIANDLGVTTPSAIRIAPTNESGTTLTLANYPIIHNVTIQGGFSEGIAWIPGPGNSQCYFGHASDIWSINSLRSAWVAPPIATGTSPCNNNHLDNLNVLNFGGGAVHPNTGVQIDLGDTTTVQNGSFNGVAAGTSPNVTPTAIRVANDATTNHNAFLNNRMEGNTLDWDIRNPATTGEGVQGLTSSYPNGCPTNWKSTIFSQQPTSVAGVTYEANGQCSGVPANSIVYSASPITSASVVTASNVVTSATPTTAWAYDNGGSPVLTVANGVCSAGLPVGDGLITITDAIDSDSIINLSGGGNVTVVARTGTHWAATSTASPGAGTSSYTFTAGNYSVCNNTGASETYRLVGLKSRPQN